MRQMIMKVSTAGAAVLSCVALAGAALAWQVVTSPNQAVLTEIANAQPGATIVVPEAFNGQLVITGKHFSSPVTIRNESSLVQAIVVRDSSNIIIEGGAVTGGTGVLYAVHIDRAKSVAIRGMTLTNTVRGIVINQSEAIGVFQNRLTGLRTDGVNIAASRNVLVEGNSCSNFNPIPAVYDEAGNLVKDGDHPDCIQSWSVSTSPPNSDLVIRGNSMTGNMQGIFLGNKVRDGIDDGGYDRVVIENNFVNISQPNGIAIEGGRVVRMVNNEIQTIDGSRLLNGAGSLVKAALKAIASTDVVACGNIVEAVPTGFGTAPCPGQTDPVAPAPAPAPAPEPAPTTEVVSAPTVEAPPTEPVVVEPTTTPKVKRGRNNGRGNIDSGETLTTSSSYSTAPVATAPTTTTKKSARKKQTSQVVAAPIVSQPIATSPTTTTTTTQPVLAVVRAVLAPTASTLRAPVGRVNAGRGSAGAE